MSCIKYISKETCLAKAPTVNIYYSRKRELKFRYGIRKQYYNSQLQ